MKEEQNIKSSSATQQESHRPYPRLDYTITNLEERNRISKERKNI